MARYLHVTSPALTGPDVLDVQRRLEALGCAPGPLDGVYGPATGAAVRAFQIRAKLEVDGVVGPQTLKALKAAAPKTTGTKTTSLKKAKPKAADRTLAAVGAGPVTNGTSGREASDLGLLALAEAVKHLGAKESPARSNRTEFGKWFGVDGCPWCAIFVSYCFVEGAGYTICQGQKGAGVYGKGCTYVPTTEAWLRATGMWKGRTTPLPGDIAIFNWDGGVPDHIGIVEEYLGNGSFHAIEGNTSYGDNSNGGEVMRRLRYLTQVNGFGRVPKQVT